MMHLLDKRLLKLRKLFWVQSSCYLRVNAAEAKVFMVHLLLMLLMLRLRLVQLINHLLNHLLVLHLLLIVLSNGVILGLLIITK